MSLLRRFADVFIRVTVCAWNSHTRTSAIGGRCRACNKPLPDARHALIES